jgi:hypothetical protein
MTYPSRGERHYFQIDPDARSPQPKRLQPLTLKACCMFSVKLLIKVELNMVIRKIIYLSHSAKLIRVGINTTIEDVY